MRKKNNNTTSIPLPKDSKEAAPLLFARQHYKEALDHYKILFKQDPCDEYRNAISKCYLQRINLLAQKKLYQEAIVLWENHCKYCPDCTHPYLYINLLLAAKLPQQAATIFLQFNTSLNQQQLTCLEEIFAALLLQEENSSQLLRSFPEESLLHKHLSLAKQAFSYFTEQNLAQLEKTLAAIPFRSPYKNLRFLLQGCALLLQGKPEGIDLLARVPSASPFFAFADTAKLALLPTVQLAKALPHLSQDEYDFLCDLKGWNLDQQKLINKLRRLPETVKPKILFDLIIANKAVFTQALAKKLCYHLLPANLSATKTFENTFGNLLAEEQLHLKFYPAIHQVDGFSVSAWLDYETALGTCQPQTETITLKRALILRHVADFIVKAHGEECGCPMSKKSITLLEESLKFDALDKVTYLKLFKHYQNLPAKKNQQKIITQAVSAFPADREILLAAITAMRRYKPLAPAIKLTRTLLALDPLNPTGQQHLVELQLLQAQKFILAQQWPRSTPLLHALAQESERLSPNYQLLIKTNQALNAYCQSDLAAAQTFTAQSVSAPILKYLSYLIEASKLNLDLRKVEKALLRNQNNLVVDSDTRLAEIVAIIKQNPSYLPWPDIIAYIERPLKKASQFKLTVADLATLCECFAQIKQFKLLRYFINKQPHAGKEPVITYYQIIAKITGDPSKLRRADCFLLEDALQQAEKIGDFRTKNLIETLLETPDDEENSDFEAEILRFFTEMFKKQQRKQVAKST